MKLSLVFAAITLPLLIIATACRHSDSVTIIIENNTDKYIDSAVVFIQNYKLKLVNIKPGMTVKKNISKDSVQLNHHDLIVRVYLFDKEKSEFTGGTYYTDLGGSLNDTYNVTIRKDFNTVITTN